MVNLKNMVSKVKAALTGADAVGTDNMEAQVLQALQNQDFEAAFAALPQQAEASPHKRRPLRRGAIVILPAPAGTDLLCRDRKSVV